MPLCSTMGIRWEIAMKLHTEDSFVTRKFRPSGRSRVREAQGPQQSQPEHSNKKGP